MCRLCPYQRRASCRGCDSLVNCAKYASPVAAQHLNANAIAKFQKRGTSCSGCEDFFDTSFDHATRAARLVRACYGTATYDGTWRKRARFSYVCHKLIEPEHHGARIRITKQCPVYIGAQRK